MKYFMVIWICLLTLMARGQFASPFNSLEPNIDSLRDYSFMVSGHFYGGGFNTTGYPANTLLANLDWINGTEAQMLVCLGDMFLDVKNDIPYYRRTFFEKLKIPLFNVVGNHDVSGNIYQENFGSTTSFRKLGSDYHLFLDTEMNDGDILGDQLKLLNSVRDKVMEETANNVFIYAHRAIWKEHYNELDNILRDNTRSAFSTNFKDDVLPILRDLDELTNVYWFTGSIGGEAPSSFFYFKDQDNGVTYIGTAIRALPRDAMLEVSVNDGDVSFVTHSLTGQELMSLEDYDVAFWEENSGREPFNWRLLPLYIKQIILSWSFFFGILFALLIGSFAIYARRKKSSEI